METKPVPTPILVWIKGGGDLGTGVAHRLHRAGLRVVVSELPQPLVVRRTVSFASAVFEGQITVEGMQARLAPDRTEIVEQLTRGIVPVVPDPSGEIVSALQPDALVDARMAKRNLGTTLRDAPVVIGLGPGFIAGEDVHAVIETMRGHDLGRVILEGSAELDTQVPAPIQGYGQERLLRAPCAGVFRSQLRIGEPARQGQVIAEVAGQPVVSNIAGILRGLLRDGLTVYPQQKVGDIDPRGTYKHCFSISDKARAIGGGVLEALLYLGRNRWSVSWHLTTKAS